MNYTHRKQLWPSNDILTTLTSPFPASVFEMTGLLLAVCYNTNQSSSFESAESLLESLETMEFPW